MIDTPVDSYLDYSGHDDIFTGGVKMIPIATPKGAFRVWTKRVGNRPTQKVLLLHGGPGFTHEYLEVFDSYFPAAGIEYYYYDQLGSYYSDEPDEENLPDLLDVARFADEVEQVRKALGLDGDNFYLYGHSWGGMLGIEYALKYQRHLKGLVLSNTVASVPKQTAHVENELMPEMDPDVLAEIEQLEEEGAYGSPQYEQLLLEHYYIRRFLRMPFEEWPEPVLRTLKHFNKKIYATLQGPSVLRVVSGTMVDWDRAEDLADITVPTLVIGAERDTMDPDHMRWMASELPSGRYHHCPDGSHLALYDDQQVYFDGLIEFIEEVDRRVV